MYDKAKYLTNVLWLDIIANGQQVKIMDSALDKVVRIGFLYDFYSNLLTEKQKEYLNMHYLQDFSLGEIAEQFGTSRQAVHDILRRAEQTLAEYEEKLGLVKRHEEEKKLLCEIDLLLHNLPQDVVSLAAIKVIGVKLKELL